MNRLLLIAVPLVLGCHGKYKKNLHNLEDVAPTVQVLTAPQVDVYLSNPVDAGESLLKAVVDIAATVGTAVEAHQLNTRLQGLLYADDVSEKLYEGLMASAGGLPYTLGEGSDTLMIQVTAYGVDVSGGTPRFFLNARTRIYDEGSERVYKSSASCSTQLGQSSAVLGFIVEGAGQFGALKTLEAMSDEDLSKMIDETVKGCGGKIVGKLMKHAG